MIKVEDNNRYLDLNNVTKFFGGEFSKCRWEVFDLEYSGHDFYGALANEMEQKSQNGIELSFEEFCYFVSTIEQVIEGVFILREEKVNRVLHRKEENALIKIIISDGSFWEIGGKMADKFIDSVGLIRMDES